MSPGGTESWLRASFQAWLSGLSNEQIIALADNWENVMNDAALDRIDSWIIAEKAIAELRRGRKS
jgi:hypothetical protein